MPPLDGVYGLVDPRVEVMFEMDAAGGVLHAYPHASPVWQRAACERGGLAELLNATVAARIAQQLEVARTAGAPVTKRLWGQSIQIRVVPRGDGALVILRDTNEDAFSRLFETAPLPLGLLSNKSTLGEGSTRFNRRFTEVFGYVAEDVPTASHWWPLAYPDPVYREEVRAEWYRRVQKSYEDRAAVEPLEVRVRCKDGSTREIEFLATDMGDSRLVVFVDVTDRNRAARELREAHEHVRTLSELLPICAWCKRMRDDGGYWQQVEQFIAQRTGAKVTHGICPDCRDTHFKRSSDSRSG
jgi:PAS domain S-box-containing protein